MEDEIKGRLIEWLDKIEQGGAEAADFLSGELPLFISELLWWHGVHSFIWFCAAICALVAAYKASVRLWRSGSLNKWWDAANPACVFVPLALGAWAAAWFVVLVSHIQWLQILVAPRVFLMEYARGLI